MLLSQQPLQRQVLYQTGCPFRVFSCQGLLHRFGDPALLAEPVAGPQLHRTPLLPALRMTRAQCIGKQVMKAKPLSVRIQRHQKDLVLQQIMNDLGALIRAADLIT